MLNYLFQLDSHCRPVEWSHNSKPSDCRCGGSYECAVDKFSWRSRSATDVRCFVETFCVHKSNWILDQLRSVERFEPIFRRGRN